MIDARRRSGDFSIVGSRVKVEDSEAGFQKVYTRDEGLALNAIFIEVVGVAIGGRYKNDTMGHEGF